jgi:hypothetical protein
MGGLVGVVVGEGNVKKKEKRFKERYKARKK